MCKFPSRRVFGCRIIFLQAHATNKKATGYTHYKPKHLKGNRKAFAHVVSPGDGALANFIVAWRLGISIPRGDPWVFDTCFRKIDEFIGKDETFVKDWPLP